ncbi:MAG: DUF4260 domain-containing protein [Polyangiales bacterium]
MNLPLTLSPLSLPADDDRSTGATLGAPRTLLRVEGAVTLAVAVALYRHLGGTWGTFAALFLVPDLSMLGYLAGPRVGAAVYNAGHTLLGPALLAIVARVTDTPAALLVALIWAAHVGFDRAAGYGLKYARGFGHTHLGAVGAAARG